MAFEVKATLTSVAGLEPSPTSHDLCLVRRSSCFVVRGGDLIAVLPREGRILWERPQRRPEPEFYRVPRRIRACGRRVWGNESVVAHLHDATNGVRVEAYEVGTGRSIWATEFKTPPPAEWAEREPAWPGAATEELEAFLATTTELVLVVHRRSRRTMRWPDVPAPARNAQLDLTGLCWATGAVVWSRSVEGVEVPILEKQDLDLVLRCPDGIVSVDPATGEISCVIPPRQNQGWPRRLKRAICASWHARGRIGVDRWHSATLTTEQWQRKGTKETALARIGSTLVLRINEQHLSALSEEGRALWEARVRTFVYGIAKLGNDLLVVGTTGAYGGAYCLGLGNGAAVGSLPCKGGVWSVAALEDSKTVAMCTSAGLVTWNPCHNGAPVTISPISPACIVGSGESGILALSGQPSAGVVLVE